MYLTHLIHDFNFDLSVETEEVLHALTFKQIKISILLTFFKSKILFHNNQGRKCTLLWSNFANGDKKNYIFIVEDMIEFHWSKGSRTIKYKYLKYANKKLVQYWLLHTFLPLYYVLENIYEMLHAGSVEINGKACLFAAESFGGKSTLTDYFSKKGHRLLSDDKLALFKCDDVYFAAGSYPYIRNDREHESLGKHVENFAKKTLPVACIYRLIQVDADAKIEIVKVKGVDKFTIIEMSCEIQLFFQKKEKFKKLRDIAEKLEIYTIAIPKNLNRLEDVYREIIAHRMA